MISLLIKPASGNCNLDCVYCFYKKLNTTPSSFMSLDTLEIIVKKAYQESTKAVIFAFQGGEPTLVGVSFYRKLIEYVKKYNRKNIPTNYTLQTNGILINEEWSLFFKKHNFLVGISLDGFEEIHDKLRGVNQKTYHKVISAIDLFNKFNVTYNILTVVSNNNCHKIDLVYEHFKEKGYNYLQFIPYCSSFENEFDNLKLTQEDYFTYLDVLFNKWFEDILSNKQISIRYFDNLVLKLLKASVNSCDLLGKCSSNIIIESNGDVYPCDFYVTSYHKIGNILTSSIEEIKLKSKGFIETKINNKCFNCNVFNLCLGGCKRYSKNPLFVETKDHTYCVSIYKFLNKNLTKLNTLANYFRN